MFPKSCRTLSPSFHPYQMVTKKLIYCVAWLIVWASTAFSVSPQESQRKHRKAVVQKLHEWAAKVIQWLLSWELQPSGNLSLATRALELNQWSLASSSLAAHNGPLGKLSKSNCFDYILFRQTRHPVHFAHNNLDHTKSVNKVWARLQALQHPSSKQHVQNQLCQKQRNLLFCTKNSLNQRLKKKTEE